MIYILTNGMSRKRYQLLLVMLKSYLENQKPYKIYLRCEDDQFLNDNEDHGSNDI